MHKISDLLTAQDQGQSSPQYDISILTDEEKVEAINWAIEQELKHYSRNLKGMGASEQQIQMKILERKDGSKIDQNEVLHGAAMRKSWKLEEIESKKARTDAQNAKIEGLKKYWNASTFYLVIKQHFETKHGAFNKNSNPEYIKTLCFFISKDARFETELKLDPKKGLLICGTAGLGKTETIKAIAGNPVAQVKIYSMIEITELVREKGECNLNQNNIILLDDVGSEPPTVKYYGTDISWFKDFIETYYLHNKEFSRLIITTNCGGEELESKYGYRVRSRMREMFNAVRLVGTDLRQ